MSDDDVALFRTNLVAVLRAELEKVPAFTIEDLLGNDEAMEALAQAILSAPLADELRPNLTVVRDPELPFGE